MTSFLMFLFKILDGLVNMFSNARDDVDQLIAEVENEKK